MKELLRRDLKILLFIWIMENKFLLKKFMQNLKNIWTILVKRHDDNASPAATTVRDSL